MCRALLSFILLLHGLVITAQVELGAVDWLRDFDQASAKSAESDKPILLLFQEVPGCMTCQNYGARVLSHPFVVEAIESLFVPLAVFNNRGGKDAQVLKRFSEPSWNNPVVRIIDAEGKDLIPRLNGNYHPSGLVRHMIMVLQELKVDVPAYLSMTLEEMQMEERGLERATFSMYCFWTGEKVYGSLRGVAYTEAGFMDGREVVNVYFDPSRTNLAALISAGEQRSCSDAVYCNDSQQKESAAKTLPSKRIRVAKDFRLDREPQYYLSKSEYRKVPMSRLQRTRINALLGHGKTVDHLLSPKQRAFLDKNVSQSRYQKEEWQRMLLTGA